MKKPKPSRRPKGIDGKEVEIGENNNETKRQMSTSGISTFTTIYTSNSGLTNIPTTLPGSIDVTQPQKQTDAGLIAGATVVGAIFLLVASLVVYMCCCRCKKDYPRKNSTYQMYSEIDASQMVVPGHLRTINSPIYGKQDDELHDLNASNNSPDNQDSQNPSQHNNVYDGVDDDSPNKQYPDPVDGKWLAVL